MELWVDLRSGAARRLLYEPAIQERGRPAKQGAYLVLNEAGRVVVRGPNLGAVHATLTGCQKFEPRPACAAEIVARSAGRRQCSSRASATRPAGAGSVHFVCGRHRRTKKFSAVPGIPALALLKPARPVEPVREHLGPSRLLARDCPVEDCQERIAPELLMCGPHWRSVPRELQANVLDLLKRAPRSKPHLEACRKAIEAASRRISA